jgi:hypothetical protein
MVGVASTEGGDLRGLQNWSTPSTSTTTSNGRLVSQTNDTDCHRAGLDRALLLWNVGAPRPPDPRRGRPAVPLVLMARLFRQTGPDGIVVGSRYRGGRMCSMAAADGHIRSRSYEYGRGNGNSLPR